MWCWRLLKDTPQSLKVLKYILNIARLFPLLFPRLHEVTLHLHISSESFDSGCFLVEGGRGNALSPVVVVLPTHIKS